MRAVMYANTASLRLGYTRVEVLDGDNVVNLDVDVAGCAGFVDVWVGGVSVVVAM